MKRFRRILVHALLVSAIVLSVCLVSCNGSSGSATMPETTKVLDEATLNCLSGASVNSSTLTFGDVTAQLNSLTVGDVIVCGVSEVTPYGLLRKVTDIVADGNQVIVETVNATLEDAIEECTVDTNWTLQSDGTFVPLDTQEMAVGSTLSAHLDDISTSSTKALGTGFYIQVDDAVLWDIDGYPDTKNDQITVDASLEIDISITIGWTIRRFKLIEAHFQPTVNVVAEFQVTGQAAVAEIHRSMPLQRTYCPTFTVMIGPVPVVVLPVVDFNVGLNGEVYAGITVGLTGNADITAGVQYSNGDWSTTSGLSASFDPHVGLTAGSKVKAYVGPRLSLLLYGAGGPYFEARDYLELDVDLFRTPWWELYGGVEGDIGFRVEAFSHTIADYEKTLAIGYRKLLAQAETAEPVALTIYSTAGGSVTTPGEGTSTYDEGSVVNLVATPAGGYRFVSWTGDVASVADVNAAETTITMNDTYSITANFEEELQYARMIAAGADHTVGLKSDGTVVAVGWNDYGQLNISGWTDIIQVAAGGMHTVGLKSDGTVVAVGSNDYGQLNIGSWTNIAEVAAGKYHTVGLKSDGTVVATGLSNSGQCNVGGWTGIVEVTAGEYHTVGVKSDGTVVAVGYAVFGQCDVGGWTNIVEVAASGDHTVGLKSDGTVVAVGMNSQGQCNVGGWTGIVQVTAGRYYFTVGLKSDGTIVGVGLNHYGQLNVSSWTNIVEVAAGGYHTVGLKADGTVVAVGWNEYGQCNVSSWMLN